jgi:transcription elongation factor GreB
LSKAFTKENDDLAEETPARSACPPGTRHYLTPDGAVRLQEEREQLLEERRRWLEKPAGLSREHRVGRIDRRLRELGQCLENAEVIPPPAGPRRDAQFGAVVTVRESEGGEYQYRLVGAPEVDLERGWVSTASPIARVLLGKRAGETVVLPSPEGPRKLTVLAVSYPE